MTGTGVRSAALATGAVLVAAGLAVLAGHVPEPAPAAVRDRPTLAGFPVDDTTAATGGVPWVWILLGVGLALATVTLFWFVLRDGLVLGRWAQRADEPPLDGDESARHRADLGRAATAALAEADAALDAGGDPREVVVACWVRLEDAARAAGIGRRPAETSSDVARRWLARPDAGAGHQAAVTTLAALFHEARYSTHPLDETDRARARAAVRGALAG